MLACLLDALGQQEFDHLEAGVEVVVVDNDPDHSARSVLESWLIPTGFALVFEHVPEPNISVARNATVRMASGEFIAFVDDDEIPTPHWLRHLVETQRKFDADAVFGPVVPRYHGETPMWLRQGGFFERPRFVTGTLIDIQNARTGNVLIKAERLKRLKEPFDPSFGRTGGEDSLLFRRLLAEGNTLRWCDEALVFEEVPMERANAAWLLRRSFRVGQTWIRAELYRLALHDRVLRGCFLGIRASMQLFVSLGCALAWLPFSRVKTFYWIRTAAAQVGKLAGMTRFQHQEYGNKRSPMG